MEFRIKSGPLDKLRTDCLIIPVYGDQKLSACAQAVDAEHNGAISRILDLGALTYKTGKTAWLSLPKGSQYERVLVVYLGAAPDKIDAKEVKTAAHMVAKTLVAQKKITQATWSQDALAPVSEQQFAECVAEAFTTSHYVYRQTRTQDVTEPALKKLTVHHLEQAPKAWKTGLEYGQAAGEGINYARELGNLPGNICTPTYLAEQALALAKSHVGALKVQVLDEKQMKKLGMGALLSVSAGSDQPAQLITMEYSGGPKKSAPIVLVGKGITFDTGGVSLKPGAGMDEMKFDMCGAASVLGVMRALLRLAPKINVIGVIAAAENMPSGGATKPGDVVTSMSGQTIEILNTDAEGRLVLCDALTYVERFKPAAVVDIATLTGACVIALGNHASGLFSNHQPLADALLSAGNEAQDRAWQMPLWEDYQKGLQSNFADMANVGGREGGSITAACFLSRYTRAYHWAHLDVAGTAWQSGGAKGATGRPVGLLLQYLTNTQKAE